MSSGNCTFVFNLSSQNFLLPVSSMFLFLSGYTSEENEINLWSSAANKIQKCPQLRPKWAKMACWQRTNGEKNGKQGLQKNERSPRKIAGTPWGMKFVKALRNSKFGSRYRILYFAEVISQTGARIQANVETHARANGKFRWNLANSTSLAS